MAQNSYNIKLKEHLIGGIYDEINDNTTSLIKTYSSSMTQSLIDTESEARKIAIEEIKTLLGQIQGKQTPVGLLTITEDEPTQEELTDFTAEKKGRDPESGDTVAVYKGDQFVSTQIYNGDEWTLWSKSNIMQEASTTIQGTTQFATNEEIKDGTSTDRVVTPADIQTSLDQIEEYYDEW